MIRTLTPHLEEDIHLLQRESMASFRASFIPPISKIDSLKPKLTGFCQLSKPFYISKPLGNNEHDFSKIQNDNFFHKYSKPPTIKTKISDDNFPLKISQIPLSESIVIEDGGNNASKRRQSRGIIAHELKSFLGFLVNRMVNKGE